MNSMTCNGHHHDGYQGVASFCRLLINFSDPATRFLAWYSTLQCWSRLCLRKVPSQVVVVEDTVKATKASRVKEAAVFGSKALMAVVAQLGLGLRVQL